MIIGIDGNEANVAEKVGVSTYTLKLLEYFQKSANKNQRFIIYLKNIPQPDLPKPNLYFTYKVVAGSFLWSQIFLPLSLYKQNLTSEKIDVFFSPAHYAPRFCPAPIVLTIHDLSYFYYPEEFLTKDLYQLKNWTKYSIAKAKKIISVSNTTKKDILRFYQVPEEKIEVIYNGYERKNKKLEIGNWKFIDKWKLEIGNYILYVGTLQPRKNIPTLLAAFKKFSQFNPKFKLVIAGKKGWLFEDIYSAVKNLGLEKKVKFVGYVSDSDLVTLYKNAFCFVIPSLYEGFGIPVLEAMSFGCPVVSSFASSLPEIGSDACLYFDPKNSTDLYEKLVDLNTNEILRSELIKKGKDRVKLFSWKTCAEKTLEVIKSVAK